MGVLTRINWNKFDDIVFNKDKHEYSLNEETFLSVTQLLKKYKHEFDKDNKILESYSLKNDLPKDYVKLKWSIDAELGKIKGTEGHYYLESKLKYNITPKVSDLLKIEKVYMDNFLNSWGLKPIKIEYIIYDEYYKIAGTIDCIAKDKKGNYFIYDWKTNKKINDYPNCDYYKYPIHHLKDNTLNSWGLQLSIYKYLLEKNLKLKITGLKIVHFNKNNSNYLEYNISYLGNEVQKIFDDF